MWISMQRDCTSLGLTGPGYIIKSGTELFLLSCCCVSLQLLWSYIAVGWVSLLRLLNHRFHTQKRSFSLQCCKKPARYGLFPLRTWVLRKGKAVKSSVSAWVSSSIASVLQKGSFEQHQGRGDGGSSKGQGAPPRGVG